MGVKVDVTDITRKIHDIELFPFNTIKISLKFFILDMVIIRRGERENK